MPAAPELAAQIRDVHRRPAAVAVHCVTAEQLVVAVAAFQPAAPASAGQADRVEHAEVPPGYADDLPPGPGSCDPARFHPRPG
ncbi:MAG TPA: hypothetical protein VK802_03610 [Streptosporangiaceae bacterium]|nr:hypothetical protein [Streptosporangiaceae bacterium]